MNIFLRRCGVSVILAPSANVMTYLLTYLLKGSRRCYTECAVSVRVNGATKQTVKITSAVRYVISNCSREDM